MVDDVDPLDACSRMEVMYLRYVVVDVLLYAHECELCSEAFAHAKKNCQYNSNRPNEWQ